MDNYLYALRYDEDNNIVLLNTATFGICKTNINILDNIVYHNKDGVKNYDTVKHKIKNIIDSDKEIILFKCSNKQYITSDGSCNTNINDIREIRSSIKNFPDARLCGFGVTCKSGQIPKVTKNALAKVQMQNFNSKATMIGAAQLEYSIDMHDNIVVNGLKNSKEKDVIIPDIVNKIAEGAFANTYIETLTLGNGIETVPKQAFKNCRKLHSVKFGNNIDEIEEEAFEFCINLRNLNISNSVRRIHRNAFYNIGADSVIIDGELQLLERDAFNLEKLRLLDVSNTKLIHLLIKDVGVGSQPILRVPKDCNIVVVG